jgi:hypothetical protein
MFDDRAAVQRYEGEDMFLDIDEAISVGAFETFTRGFSYHLPPSMSLPNGWIVVSRGLNVIAEARALEYLKSLLEAVSLHTYAERDATLVSLSLPDTGGTSADETIYRDPPELEEALLDLYSCKMVAEEENLVTPASEAVRSADRVLRSMYYSAPRPYAVYPTPEGEIAIDAHTPQGTKVVVICSTDGSAHCLTYINGEFDRREYEKLSAIPDDFTREALRRADELAV